MLIGASERRLQQDRKAALNRPTQNHPRKILWDQCLLQFFSYKNPCVVANRLNHKSVDRPIGLLMCFSRARGAITRFGFTARFRQKSTSSPSPMRVSNLPVRATSERKLMRPPEKPVTGKSPASRSASAFQAVFPETVREKTTSSRFGESIVEEGSS